MPDLRRLAAVVTAWFDEFIDLARRTDRTPDDERRLSVLKQEMADRLMARPAVEVYDVDV